MMKQLPALMIILSLLSSCSESFNRLDTKTFNEQISGRTDIKTPEELIKLYYDYPESEGNPKLSVKSNNFGAGDFEIILIHEGLEDDSQSVKKVIMIARKTGDTWSVKAIKENWKCRSGRGHTSWGTATCH